MKKNVVVWSVVGAIAVAGIGLGLQSQEPLQEGVRVLFVGDIMLDRTVATHARAVGDQVLFTGVRSLFAGHDAVVGNLEGAITDNPSLSQASTTILRFTFLPRMASVLREAGVTAVSLANNHALDFGEFGYDDTLHYLGEQGIVAFGSPFNDKYRISTKLLLHGQQLCLVGYHPLFRNDSSAVLAEIVTIRPECAHVVVVAHWGEEYQHLPTAVQRTAAHAFIDAGADVVIGAHPHVVQPLEVYKGKAIFYSLGNFIFDQGWMPEVRRGLAVGIEFGSRKTSFTLTAIDTFKEARVSGATTTRAVLADVLAPDLPTGIANSIQATGSFELAK